MAAVPADTALSCPRCKFRWYFGNYSEGGVNYRCGGCEWWFSLGTPAIAAPGVPASTVNATNATGTIIGVTISGGTLTAVTVNGTQVGTTAGTYLVPNLGTINITYTVAPSWTWQLPVSNGAMTIGAVALPVASGGAYFTQGTQLFIDSATSSEVLTVGSGSGATSIVVGASAKAHNSAVSFGQVLISPVYNAVQQVPGAPGWGF